MSGSGLVIFTGDGQLAADFCRMAFPAPAIQQIIGKSIETVGRTVKIDPEQSLVTGSLRAARRGLPHELTAD
jgi:hypothetical protein